jgi:glycosyltransferase involved in cell wall biosynthesis
MRRVKILQLITGLGAGGAERLLLDLGARFDQDRFDLRIASISEDLSARDLYGHDDFDVSVYDVKQGPRLRELLRLRHFVHDFAPDVIHAHMFHALLAAWAATKLSRARRTPICFTSHNATLAPKRALLVRATKRWRRADIIFSANQHLSLNAARTEVIPNGVTVSNEPIARQPWSPGGTIRLIAVGRLAPQKDPLGLLRSLASSGLPNFTLDFLGEGPLEAEARALAESLGIADRVTFCGLCEDVRGRMRRADIFVMHSAHEGMPMALLEAGAEAMPVVATPVGSIPDVLGEDRGWLALPEQFAERLAMIAGDPVAAVATGRRLHHHVRRNYVIEQAVRSHERLYMEMIDDRFS